MCTDADAECVCANYGVVCTQTVEVCMHRILKSMHTR